MTDNQTTELREKLTERGVEWWPMHNNGYYEDRDTEFVVNGKKHTAHEWGDGLAVYNLTSEQAIAATLRNERAAHGMLTAEQVREAVERHGNIMDNRLYEDWQAVTDELNATLGSETCRNIDDEFPFFKCSKCGCNAVVGYGSSGDGLPNYCPNCGSKVIG